MKQDPSRSRGPILFLALAAAAGTVLFSLLPYAMAHANWVFNVLRNWLEYGYGTLHGQLVSQPGGLTGVASPLVYTGHRPAFLLPHFAGVWAARDVQRGLLLYNGVLNAALVATIWTLLGRSRRGLFAAAALVTCPGWTRLMIPEPIGSTVALGLVVVPWLVREVLQSPPRKGRLLATALLAAVWMQMNWTSVFVLAPLSALLWMAAPAPSRRLLAGLALVLGLAFLPVLTASMGSRMPSDTAARFDWIHMLASYSWGAQGYGHGNPVTWTTALIRLAAAGVVGVLPLGLVWLWEGWHVPRPRGLVLLRCALPLLVTGAMLLLMRNYFAEHPWMESPVLAVGLVGSLGLLPTRPAEDGPSTARLYTALGLSLFYALLVLALFAVQTTGLGEVAALVQRHTPRPAVIVLDADVAAIPHFADRAMMASDMDRLFVLPDETASSALAGRPRYLLTHAERPDRGLCVARSSPARGLLASAIERSLGWYRQHLGRRRHGDAIDFRGPFFLYRLPDVDDPH